MTLQRLSTPPTPTPTGGSERILGKCLCHGRNYALRHLSVLVIMPREQGINGARAFEELKRLLLA
jgi:hypothetical protein